MPNAGVSEIGAYDTVTFHEGKPVKPNTATLDVNLIGVLYSKYQVVDIIRTQE